jgi:hypothetical protein
MARSVRDCAEALDAARTAVITTPKRALVDAPELHAREPALAGRKVVTIDSPYMSGEAADASALVIDDNAISSSARWPGSIHVDKSSAVVRSAGSWRGGINRD